MRRKKLTFFGGATTVTGSKALLEIEDKKILIDCGLFQGMKELRLMNWEPFPFDPELLDAVFVTHAHLDHTGALPLLCKKGYDGPIYMSEPTKDLALLILLDSAQIQVEEAEQANRYGYSKHHPAKPLYDTEDVKNALQQFSIIEIDKWITLYDGIFYRYQMNGHILGSCFIEFKIDDEIITFSGDIGRQDPLLVFPPKPLPQTDYLILESTYGDRLHHETTKMELSSIINETFQRGGNLIIPSFAIERAQEIIFLINKLKDENFIPDIPIYLDSPMAIDASEIMCRYPEWHQMNLNQCMCMFQEVKMIRDSKRSAMNIENKEKKIVIAGSGMISGGRVLDYLARYIEDNRTTVLITGYQAEGTRGRDLLNKVERIKIKGQYYTVNAEVKTLNGLSGHGDQEELIAWLKTINNIPKKILLNHGEDKSAQALKTKIEEVFGWSTEVALMSHIYHLDSN